MEKGELGTGVGEDKSDVTSSEEVRALIWVWGLEQARVGWNNFMKSQGNVLGTRNKEKVENWSPVTIMPEVPSFNP